MTVRELYEYALIELNKLEAPSLLLEDYNYFINKAIQQYINLVYSKFEIDQQSTDDIRALKASTVLSPSKIIEKYQNLPQNGLFKSSYYVDLPADYMHLMNCVVEFTIQKSGFKCYDVGDVLHFAARRLTPDMYTQVLNNAYMRPMYKRPYYYLSNINTQVAPLPTNPEMDDNILSANGIELATATEKATYYTKLAAYETAKAALEADPGNATKQQAVITAENELRAARAAFTNGAKTPPVPSSSLVNAYNEQGDRLSNPSTVRLELRYGQDDGIFVPTNVYIDYLKSPMYIRLTQEQINATLDYSQVLEFPDYVCFEIANIFVRLLMENASDPRLQTNMPINSTIAQPAAMQAAQQQASK